MQNRGSWKRPKAALAAIMDGDRHKYDVLVASMTRRECVELARLLHDAEEKMARGTADLQMKMRLLEPHMPDDRTTVEEAAAKIPCRSRRGLNIGGRP